MKNTASRGEMPYSEVGYSGRSAAAAGALEGNFFVLHTLEGTVGMGDLSKLTVKVNVIEIRKVSLLSKPPKTYHKFFNPE